MGKLIEVVGWIVIVISLAIAAFSGKVSSIGPLLVALYLFPVIFSGMLIVAFGRMLTELIAIRMSAERQERLLSGMASGRAAVTETSDGRTFTPLPKLAEPTRDDWKRPY